MQRVALLPGVDPIIDRFLSMSPCPSAAARCRYARPSMIGL